jgi:cytochrome c biogenesis protein
MSVTRNRPVGADPAPGQGAWGRTYGFLSSVKFTIFLLSLIAAGSVFGTVIKQRAPVEEYLSLYSESTFKFIKFFRLDDTYHSPWFYCLIVLFIVNLVLCTAGRFSRFLGSGPKTARLPDEQAMAEMENHFRAEGKSRSDVERVLERSYRLLGHETEGSVYEKGGLSRYGVFIIHISIILILLGGFTGATLGYRGSMVLVKGETSDRVSLRGENNAERHLGFSLKCEDFSVAFYPGGEPKDYVSTIKVMDKGKVVKEKQVRVNDPLYYKGVHVYQATYGRTPSFLFHIGGERVILRERETFKKGDLLLMVVRFEKMVHNFGPGVLIAYLDNGRPRTSWFLKDVDNLKEKQLAGVSMRLDGIEEEYYTGLEVSKDPGVWIVWTGFALMLFGLYANFFTYYRKMYVRQAPGGVLVAGMAPKRKELFREDFARMKTKVSGNES